MPLRSKLTILIFCGLLVVACVHKIDVPKGLPSDGVNRNPPGTVIK